MGTLLYGAAWPLDACFDQLNLNRPPRRSEAVHADYLAAGAELIETNTFGANRFKLESLGGRADVRTSTCAASSWRATCARAAGQPTSSCRAPWGPTGQIRWRHWARPTAEEARAAFREQAEALLEGGVDAFIVETFSDLTEITLAIEAIRAVTELPIVAQMAFTDEGVTFTGRSPAEVARPCGPWGWRRWAPIARWDPASSTRCWSRWCRSRA